MKSKFWMQYGILYIYGSSLDAQTHKHNAIQVIWPIDDCLLTMENKTLHHPIVIASDVEHRLQMAAGWVVLIEPQSILGEQLKTWLELKSHKQIEALENYTEKDHSQLTDPVEMLESLFIRLGLDVSNFNANMMNSKMDSRIQQLQSELNKCFDDECLKPEKWLAAQVASELALSESRFLHLFKQEMKIAWRPYLLWRRLLCAINFMQKGGSATEAAYIAGFSDSAHLSRTFRSKFGISIRQAQASFK
jgi:AraC-like DNA-binding protein